MLIVSVCFFYYYFVCFSEICHALSMKSLQCLINVYPAKSTFLMEEVKELTAVIRTEVQRSKRLPKGWV